MDGSPPQSEAPLVPATFIAVGAAGLLYGLAEIICRYALQTHSPLLAWVNRSRAAELLAIYTAQGAIGRGALLALPLLGLAWLAHRAVTPTVWRSLGLQAGLRSLLALLTGALEGILWCWLALLALSFLTQPRFTLNDLHPIDVLLFHVRSGWLSLQGGGAAHIGGFLAVVLGYAVSRLVLSHGHLLGLLRDHPQPALAAAAVAGLFSLPYLLSPFATPLAWLNAVLMGLVGERLVALSGGLWYSIGALAGWVGFALLANQPTQGIPATRGPAPFRPLPDLLSGGSYGFEGGLVVTLVLAFLLLVLLTVRRRPTS